MQKIAVISPSRTLTTKISEILQRRSLSFKIVQAGQEEAPLEAQKLVQEGVDAAIGGLSLEQEVTDRGIAYIMTSTDEDAVCDAIDEALHLMDIEEERAKKEKELQRSFSDH